MYPDDSLLVRTDALSRIVSELKKLFTNVNITSNLIQNFIDVAWTKPNPWVACSYDDLPEKLLSLPELGETDVIKENADTVKKQMSELSSKFTTGFKNVTSILGKKRVGKSALIDAYIKESQGDSSTIIFTVPVGDEKEEQQEQQEDDYS
jgi:molybdopterin/thiamine biosynthesis adenylyltransferase